VPESNPIRPEAAAGSTPEKILDTAEALFARRGFGGVGLREVARVSGLSKSALFHHFPTKLDLYGAVLTRILSGLGERVFAEVDSDGSALANLIGVVERLIDALAESPMRAPLLLRTLFEDEVSGGELIPEADAILADVLGQFRALIDAGIASGELRDVPSAHVLQTLLGGLVFHFASGEFGDELLGQPVYSAAEIRRHKTFLISYIQHGLAAQPQGE
jgi:AcrR family transcriptional regulator